MTNPVYRTEDGALAVGRRLGRGGEGEVFALDDGTSRALKIYVSPDADRERKVREMISAGLAQRCPSVAFPSEAALSAAGVFVGFVMPLVEDALPLHDVCSVGSRRRLLPNADWRFLVRTALNTARVFERVHAAGAVVGDVNASGVLVSRRALVSLIDADSFQLGPRHLCRVGVPEYTPPELQGRSLEGVVRTPEHDGFGLAVLLFQLLLAGRHPHAGIPAGRDMPLPEAIARHQFAYSRIRRVALRPPTAAPTLQDLPLGTATLFERAFTGFSSRPSAREWVAELERLERSIVPCRRMEGHHVAGGAAECPWCRIEMRSGSVVFGHGMPVREASVAPSDPATPDHVGALLARVRSYSGEAVLHRSGPAAIRPSAAATETLTRHGWKVPRGPLHLAPSRRADVGKPFLKAFALAQRELDKEVEAWRTRIGAWSLLKPMADLEAVLDRSASSSRRRAAVLADVVGHLRRGMVEEELAKLRLSTLTLPGVGRRSLDRLAAAGVANAADLGRTDPRGMPGISERAAASLLIWRDSTAAAMEFEVVVGPADVAAATDALHERWRLEDEQSEADIARLAGELELRLRELAARAGVVDARVAEAQSRHDQAKADLAHLGLDVPTAKQRPALAAVGRSRGTVGPSCPDCGGPMVKRWAQAGWSPNRFFLGCSRYPSCSGSRPLRRR